jgi:hypothetical protein
MKMNILKKTVAACSVAAFMAVGCVSVAQAYTSRIDPYGDTPPIKMGARSDVTITLHESNMVGFVDATVCTQDKPCFPQCRPYFGGSFVSNPITVGEVVPFNWATGAASKESNAYMNDIKIGSADTDSFTCLPSKTSSVPSDNTTTFGIYLSTDEAGAALVDNTYGQSVASLTTVIPCLKAPASGKYASGTWAEVKKGDLTKGWYCS